MNKPCTGSAEHTVREEYSENNQNTLNVQGSQDNDSDAWNEDDETEEGPAGAFGTMMLDDIIDLDISKCFPVVPNEDNRPGLE